ncbi:cysteine ase [Fusarium beomiforme]|uniref:Cysteine ase n=1 Tax=Fusarium beomiforme TaxID=44412 RepID=A0A9P5A8Y1_9HYPO|nr:cysteine ase [Fusarium beomiforme]
MANGFYEADGFDFEDKPYIYSGKAKNKNDLISIDLAHKYPESFERYAMPSEITVVDAVCAAIRFSSKASQGFMPRPSRRFIYYNARALPLMDVYKSSTKWPDEVRNVSVKIRQVFRAVRVYGLVEEEVFPWAFEDFSHAKNAVWGINERPPVRAYGGTAPETETEPETEPVIEPGTVIEPYRLDSYQPEVMSGMDEFELRALRASTLARIRLCLSEEYPVIFTFHLFWDTFKTVPAAQSGDRGFPTIEKIPAERRMVGPRWNSNHGAQAALIVGLEHEKRRLLVKGMTKFVEYFWMPYEWIIDVYATQSFWIIRNTRNKIQQPRMERIETNSWYQQWDTLRPWKLKAINNSSTVSMAPNSSISVISRNTGVLDMFWISDQCTVEWVYYNPPKHKWKRQTVTIQDEGMKSFPGAIASVSVAPQKLDIFWMTASGAICNASTEVNIDTEPAIWKPSIICIDGTVEPRAGIAATAEPADSYWAGLINIYCVGPGGSIEQISTLGESPYVVKTIAGPGSAHPYSNLSAVANYVKDRNRPVDGYREWLDAVVWITPDGTIAGKRGGGTGWVDLWNQPGEVLAWPTSRISAVLHCDNGDMKVYYVTKNEKLYCDTAIINVMPGTSYSNHKEVEAFGAKKTNVRRNSDIKAIEVFTSDSSGPGTMVLWQNQYGQLMIGSTATNEYWELSKNRGVRQGSPLGIALCNRKPVIGMKIDDGVIAAGYWGDISAVHYI